jgi:hypothetical protein
MNHQPVDLYYQSYAHLQAGDYATGFRLFEHRWHPQAIASLPEPFTKYGPAPVWQGQPLQGKSILVQMEMGYGDCIQFARFLPILKVFGAQRLVVLATGSLLHLLSKFDCIDHLTNDEKTGQSQTTDYWIGSMSLPYIALHSPAWIRAMFPITKKKVMGSEGYFDITPSSIEPKIGVNWDASKRFLHGVKSTTAEKLKALCGTNCYSLNPTEQGPFHALPDDGWKTNWLVTAAHMKAMKAVVTVDTGTAHMAGALGVKTIVLLPPEDHICWRWKNAKWYDSVMTLRQHEWHKVPSILKGLHHGK